MHDGPPPRNEDLEARSSPDLEAEIRELQAHINAATARQLKLVAELERRAAWSEWGYTSGAEWLSVAIGTPASSARRQVRVATALEELPETSSSFASGELSFAKVAAIAPVATAATEHDLVEIAKAATAGDTVRMARGFGRAREAADLDATNERHDRRYLRWRYEYDGGVSLHARFAPEDGLVVKKAVEAKEDDLYRAIRETAEAEAETRLAWRPAEAVAADALVALAKAALATEAESRDANPYHVVVHVDADALKRGSAGGGETEEGALPLHSETVRRFACDSTLQHLLQAGGKTLDVGRKTRAISRPIRRALDARDRTCRFPGCARTRLVDAHHILHWIDWGETRLDNLVKLCRRHHRLVHEGGFTIEVGARDALVFRRPNGMVITPAGPRRAGPDLHERHRAQGLQLHAETMPAWQGEYMDHDLAVEALLQTEFLFERRRSDGRPPEGHPPEALGEGRFAEEPTLDRRPPDRPPREEPPREEPPREEPPREERPPDT